MITVSARVLLKKPPEKVFPVAADPSEQRKWDARNLLEVEKLNEGPLSQGACYRGRFKGLGTVIYEFVEYKPPQRFVHFALVPMGRLRHIFQFKAVEAGTELTQSIIVDPTLLGKVLAPLVRPMLQKRIEAINAGLREHLRK